MGEKPRQSSPLEESEYIVINAYMFVMRKWCIVKVTYSNFAKQVSPLPLPNGENSFSASVYDKNVTSAILEESEKVYVYIFIRIVYFNNNIFKLNNHQLWKSQCRDSHLELRHTKNV